jgi:hypothetical protein
MQSVLKLYKMGNRIVSVETAELAMKCGFDIETDKGYYKHGSENDFVKLLLWVNAEEEKPEFGYAPTQSLLQKWLREKRIDITVITNWEKENRVYYVGFSFVNHKNEIEMWFSKDENRNKIEYSKYEDALEVGLFESLKRVSETVA